MTTNLVKIKLRSSALPRIGVCGGSAVVPGIVLDISDIPAELGSAVHDVCMVMAREGLTTIPELSPFLEKYPGIMKEGLFEDFKILCYCAAKLLNKIRERVNITFIEMKVKATLGPWSLTGTPDIGGETMNKEGEVEGLDVLDYKSGRNQHCYRDQLMGYLYSLMVLRPTAKWGRAAVAWIRDQVIVPIRSTVTGKTKISREEIMAWAEDMIEHVKRGAYTPGEACYFCPSAPDCKARETFLVGIKRDLMSKDMQDFTPEKLGSMWEGVSLLKKSWGAYDKLIKKTVDDKGSIVINKNYCLQYRIEPQKEILPTEKGISVIMEYFDIKELQGILDFLNGWKAVKIGKGKLEDAIGDYAPKGKKGKDITAMIENLDAAGAIRIKEIKKLSKKIIQKGIKT